MRRATFILFLGLAGVTAASCGKPAAPPAAKPAADAGAVAAAGEDGRTADYAACSQAANDVTTRELDCLDAEFERQDKAMNATYTALMTRLDAHIRQEVRGGLAPDERLSVQAKATISKAQRAWAAWRDLECEAAATPNLGGTIVPIVTGNCRIDLTVDRGDALKDLLDNFAEG